MNYCICVYFLLLPICCTAFSDHNETVGKVLSLFNVVQFKNDACTSTSSITSGITPFRNGTCFTSDECISKGGSAQGSCAAGFGVCCVFTTTTCGAQITQNNTYVQNPGFPNTLTTTTACTYILNKYDSTVCSVRLDFQSFNILPPALLEVTGGVCQDTFSVTGISAGVANNIVPTICGINTGQHIYFDLGNLATDTATLNFAFLAAAAAGTVRQWDIQISQIPCSANYRAPNGCLQYQTGTSGTIKTFNFDNTNIQQHISNQQYSTCIRQETGFCCIQYSVCTDANSFTIFNSVATALVNTDCTLDYISIEGASRTCQNNNLVNTVTRYCGGTLSAFRLATASETICDCSTPFQVSIRSDNTGPDVAAAISRGVCLNWKQLPC